MKTDTQIQKDVMDELNWEPMLNSSEIGVAVTNGVVTLSGTVDSFIKKITAEKAAARVGGVKVVAEDIDVKLYNTLKKTDTEIGQAIAIALQWNSAVNGDKLKVKVENGWVTLEGDLEWEFQKRSAKVCVENILGVRGVSNLIIVRPKIDLKDLKQKITSAYHRHASIDAKKISIDIKGNKVILKGKVRSLAEKNDAETAAWAAPGVQYVENSLDVEYTESLLAY